MNFQLYETHVETSNLERSIAFYRSLGLSGEHVIESRRVAFFSLGEPGEWQQMLGIWETKEGKPAAARHFAFAVPLGFLENAVEWLAERGIETREAFGRGNVEPIVHSWMPAAAIYFRDPDGNSLEFITKLPHPPMELDYTPILSEWQALQANR